MADGRGDDVSEWLETPEAERVSYEPARELRRVYWAEDGRGPRWQVWTTGTDPQPVTRVYESPQVLAAVIAGNDVMGNGWRPTYAVAAEWVASQMGESE